MTEIGNVELRDYQDEAHDAVFHAFMNGIERVLIQLPTGTGKTVLMGAVAYTAIHKYRWPVLVIAHRNELLNQATDKFDRMGIDTVQERGESNAQSQVLFGSKGSLHTVVVGSISTMKGRRLDSWPQERFGLIMVDETHHIVAANYRKLLNHFKSYVLLGVTATADRADGQNLGKVFTESDKPVYEFPLKNAIELGYLARITIARIHTGIDITRVKKTTEGDLNLDDLGEIIAPEITHLCKQIANEMGDRKTILFAPNLATSQAFASCFNTLRPHSIAARSVDSYDDPVYRQQAIDDFHAGRFQVLCNFGLFTEGYDEPTIECVVQARPTTSRALYSQMVGRGTRKKDSGRDCLLIDLVMNSEKHDLVHPIELFDTSELDEEITTLAIDMVNKGETKDLAYALDLADHVHRERKKLRVIAREVDMAKYRKVTYDPMGLSDLGLVSYRRSDFDGSWRATPEQCATLRRMGIDNPEQLTRTGAQRRINALGHRMDKHLCSHKQLAHLIANGVEPEAARNMSKSEASRELDRIFKAKRGVKV